MKELPDSLNLATWNDMAYYVDGRIKLMSENLLLGGLLGILVLGLFLNLRVAFRSCWNSSVLRFLVDALGDVTVNVLSLFAFIMVLGIVVDDAIIVGESVFSAAQEEFENRNSADQLKQENHRTPVETVVAGAL